LLYIAATNGGAFDNPENPKNLRPVVWGCDADPSIFVKDWDAQGNVSLQFPCFDFPTMMDRLESAGLTWKFYDPPLGFGYEWTAVDAINHIRNTSRWNQVVPITQFVQDALNGNLPTVSWLVADSSNSEHPGKLPLGASACEGENWTVEQINAIMQGPLWSSTAIFVTWDDSGGFFDHVAPPSIAPYILGLRVPLLIISPYAKSGYVSHTQYSHYSMLTFIESIFNLPALTTLDANSSTMLDSFDFTQSPLPQVVLQPRACPLMGVNTVGFGGQLVGMTKGPSSVRLLNRRSTSLNVNSITTGGSFTQTNDCPQTLDPTDSCFIKVSFTPASMGATSGELTVSDSDSTSPQTVTLTGTGSAIQLSRDSLSYNHAGIGTKSAPQSITVTNSGASSLSLGTIQTVGDFSQTHTCGTSLDPAGTCTVTVTFNPTQSGQIFGALFINSSDPAAPHRVLMSGWGDQASFQPGGLAFGTQKVGNKSVPKTIQVHNLGGTPLNFASFAVGGDFAQTNTCGTGILPGTSCAVSVTFKPTVIGARAGQITVTDSDLRNPQVLKLSGTGK
jgi:hypothetical protein